MPPVAKARAPIPRMHRRVDKTETEIAMFLNVYLCRFLFLSCLHTNLKVKGYLHGCVAGGEVHVPGFVYYTYLCLSAAYDV